MTVPPPSYQCPHCNRVSYHPRDIEERFCGGCGMFEDDPLDILDDGVSSFRCVSCQNTVMAFGCYSNPIPPVCSTCAWIGEYIPDPEHAKKIMAHLHSDEKT